MTSGFSHIPRNMTPKEANNLIQDQSNGSIYNRDPDSGYNICHHCPPLWVDLLRESKYMSLKINVRVFLVITLKEK